MERSSISSDYQSKQSCFGFHGQMHHDTSLKVRDPGESAVHKTPAYSNSTAKAYLDAARGIMKGTQNLKGAHLKVIVDNARQAIEMAMKALLENAGFSEDELRRVGHCLSALLRLLFECVEKIKIGDHWYERLPIEIGCIVLKYGGGQITFGKFVEESEKYGSPYPSGVRYGSEITTFPGPVWLQAAEKAIAWAEQKMGKIRRVQATKL